MSLIEVLPHVHSLSRTDKLRLIQVVAQELAEVEEPTLVQANGSYPVWSPDSAFSAAAALLEALKADKEQP